MNELYDKCVRQWDRIFEEAGCCVPASPDTGIPALNEALDWLCEKTSSVLDFGCGNGILLFLCALRGTKRHVGIDLSAAGIHAAKRSSEQAATGQYSFLRGGIERFHEIAAAPLMRSSFLIFWITSRGRFEEADRRVLPRTEAGRPGFG